MGFGGCEVGSIDYRTTELINRRISGGFFLWKSNTSKVQLCGYETFYFISFNLDWFSYFYFGNDQETLKQDFLIFILAALWNSLLPEKNFLKEIQ